MENNRLYFIDWLRSIVILLLVPLHSGLFFYHYGYHFKNEELSIGLTSFNHFVFLWFLPLLFLLAGAGSFYALTRRKGGHYLKERALRLIIPLVFGILVFVPPQVYFERLFRGEFTGSFIEFFPNFFNGIYPVGNFSWHHLWFLVYLFTFSLLTLPLFIFFKTETGMNSIQKFSRFFSKGGNIFLLSIPIIIFEAVLRVNFPAGIYNLVSDWATFLNYFTNFIYGYIIFSSYNYFEKSFERNKKLAVILSVIGYAIILGIEILEKRPIWSYSPANLSYIALEGFITWNMIISLLGYGKKYLNLNNKVIKYLNEAALPFYIIHQSFVIGIGYFILRKNLGVWPKFMLIVIFSYISTAFSYELFFKRVGIIRFLLGMKKK